MWRSWTLKHCRLDSEMVAATVENHVVVLQKVNPHPKEQKRDLREMSAQPHAEQRYSQQPRGGNKPRVHQWIDGHKVLATHNGILLRPQKEDDPLPSCVMCVGTGENHEDVVLREISPSQKGKHSGFHS